MPHYQVANVNRRDSKPTYARSRSTSRGVNPLFEPSSSAYAANEESNAHQREVAEYPRPKQNSDSGHGDLILNMGPVANDDRVDQIGGDQHIPDHCRNQPNLLHGLRRRSRLLLPPLIPGRFTEAFGVRCRAVKCVRANAWRLPRTRRSSRGWATATRPRDECSRKFSPWKRNTPRTCWRSLTDSTNGSSSPPILWRVFVPMPMAARDGVLSEILKIAG